MRRYWQVRITRPDGSMLPAIDINPRREGLSWSREVPWGDGECRVGLAPAWDDPSPRYYLPEPIEAPWHARLEVLLNGWPVWRGRIVERERPGGQVRGVIALGEGAHGSHDDRFLSRGGTMMRSGRLLAHTIRATAVPFRIAADRWQEPGTAHSVTEAYRTSPGQLAEQVMSEGGDVSGVAVPWQFVVYGGEARLIAAVPPVVPRYAIAIDDEVTIQERGRELYDRLRLSWTDPDQVEHLTGEFRATPWGISRRVVVDGSAETSAAAVQFARVELARRSSPEIGVTIRRQGFRGLALAGGAEVPGPLLLPGLEWCRVVGVGDLPVTRVDFDAADESSEIALGSGVTGRIVRAMERLQHTDDALRSRRDVVTRRRMRNGGG